MWVCACEECRCLSRSGIGSAEVKLQVVVSAGLKLGSQEKQIHDNDEPSLQPGFLLF